MAVLNANYLKNGLKGLFTIPYPQICMHEFVLQADKYLDQGVKALDIAKRLLDYGIHAPTVYFPLIVKECMLIEPTESESKSTLDEFLAVFQKIVYEIQENPDFVKQAPHQMPVSRLDEVQAARRPILTASKIKGQYHGSSILFNLSRSCKLFKDLNESELNALFNTMIKVKIEPGEVLITQGEISDCMYVLLSGRLLVKQADGKTIAQIGRGQTVGEMGVITNEPRSATVVAMRESILLKLEEARFSELWNRHPNLLFEITKIIAKRLRKTLKPPQKFSNNINILVVKGNQQADMKLFLD